MSKKIVSLNRSLTILLDMTANGKYERKKELLFTMKQFRREFREYLRLQMKLLDSSITEAQKIQITGDWKNRYEQANKVTKMLHEIAKVSDLSTSY